MITFHLHCNFLKVKGYGWYIHILIYNTCDTFMFYFHSLVSSPHWNHICHSIDWCCYHFHPRIMHDENNKSWNRANRAKDKWPLDFLSWERRAHSLMKRSISCLGVLCTSMVIGIKWCLSWSPLYLWISVMVLTSATTLVGQLMTLKAIVSCIGSVATTLVTKT
jgi:hypothetical protein